MRKKVHRSSSFIPQLKRTFSLARTPSVGQLPIKSHTARDSDSLIKDVRHGVRLFIACVCFKDQVKEDSDDLRWQTLFVGASDGDYVWVVHTNGGLRDCLYVEHTKTHHIGYFPISALRVRPYAWIVTCNPFLQLVRDKYRLVDVLEGSKQNVCDVAFGLTQLDVRIEALEIIFQWKLHPLFMRLFLELVSLDSKTQQYLNDFRILVRDEDLDRPPKLIAVHRIFQFIFDTFTAPFLHQVFCMIYKHLQSEAYSIMAHILFTQLLIPVLLEDTKNHRQRKRNKALKGIAKEIQEVISDVNNEADTQVILRSFFQGVARGLHSPLGRNLRIYTGSRDIELANRLSRIAHWITVYHPEWNWPCVPEPIKNISADYLQGSLAPQLEYTKKIYEMLEKY